ncbi:DMT family transporter [Candidatus Hodarchaeum mangrovi]
MPQSSHFWLNYNFLTKSLIIVIFWSTPPLISKLWVGSGVFPGIYYGFLRYGLGFATLFLFILLKGKFIFFWKSIREKSWKHIICASWLIVMIIGQNFSVFFILGSSSSILLNFNPVFIYLLSPLLFSDEYYSNRKNIGILISTLGIFLVFFASMENYKEFNPQFFIVGNILGVLSGIGWAGYSLSLKWLFKEKESEEITSINLLIATIILFSLSIFLEGNLIPPINVFTVSSLFGLVIIGVGAAALAFTLYFELVQQYGASNAANIQFLIPLFSLFFGFIFIGEFSILTMIGGIISAIGLIYTTKSS